MANAAPTIKSDGLILLLAIGVGAVAGGPIAMTVANLFGFGYPSLQRYLCGALGLVVGTVVPLKILRNRRLRIKGNVDNLDALIIKTYELGGAAVGPFIAIPIGDGLGYRSDNWHLVLAGLGAAIGCVIGDLLARHSRFNPETKVQL